MPSTKPRIWSYIDPINHARLKALAKRPGSNESQIVNDALTAFFMGEHEVKRDAALIRRLDRLTRQYERVERNLSITAETLALYIRFFLTVTPPLPNADQDAARALGKERFEYFTTQLARRLAGGKNMIRYILEEASADDGAFFTQRELDALRAVKTAASPSGDEGQERPNGEAAATNEVEAEHG